MEISHRAKLSLDSKLVLVGLLPLEPDQFSST